MELVFQRQSIGWQGQLPKLRWLGSKNIILLSLFAVFCLLLPSAIVLAGGFGGLASEKLMGRTGVANSQLLIGRDGVANSNLDVGLAPIVTTLAATNVSMDAGGTSATLRGSVDNLNGFPAASVWFEWGYDTTYGNVAGTQNVTALGTYTGTITNFAPNTPVFYRIVGKADGTLYGSGRFISASGTPAFNIMNGLVPILFVGLIIILLIGLLKSDTPVLLMVVIGGIAIYIGINFLEAIVAAMQNLW